MSDSEASEFLAEMNAAALFQPGKWCQLAIADFTTDVLIGDVGVYLAPDANNAEIGFSMDRKSQGAGLATEAVRGTIRLIFEHTPAGRVHATTDARNIPCIRLLERIGMRQVDTLNTQFRGEPCVEYVFEVCRHRGD
jgi:RimJ/RimL family protein N-acetyltransferase